MANVFDIAEYILKRCGAMSALKLQGIIYYSQGWSLAWDNEPLFNEIIEAHDNLIVIPVLYKQCKKISEQTRKYRLSHGALGGNPDNLTPGQKDTVNAVCNAYSQYNIQQLGQLIRGETPFIHARENSSFTELEHNTVIPLADMADFFKKQDKHNNNHSDIPLHAEFSDTPSNNIISNNSYFLRLFDDNLLAFSLNNGGLDGLTANILWINSPKSHLLPPDLTLSDDGLVSWLKRRVIPKNRAFVHKILQSMQLTTGDTKGIIDVCLGLSLNDCYWVVPANFTGSFSKYNLYQNPFSNALSLIAYTGRGNTHNPLSTSPELTTHGMLRKAWRVLHDGIYLFKGGSEGFANSGLEPYSEFYAAQIARRMGLRHVHYDLVRWKNILASKCRLFTDVDTSYIPIGHIVKTGGLSACLDYFSGISAEALDDVKSMLVFDALIYNEDRHFGNFGVLMDSHKCKIFAAAPIFDNGISLFNYAMNDEIDNLQEYAQTRTNPYDISYETICREVMGKKQRGQLKQLIGFRFTRHTSYNLPEKRLKAIEWQINRRVRQLLDLPKH